MGHERHRGPSIRAQRRYFVRRSGVGAGEKLAARPRCGVHDGCAGAGHLLWHADHGAAVGRQGRSLGFTRVRLRGDQAAWQEPPVRKHRGPHQRQGPGAAGRVDVPRRPGDADSAGLRAHRLDQGCAHGGHGGREARAVRHPIPSGGYAHHAGRPDLFALRARDLRLREKLDRR